ncbi:response regulator [Myxosarcina sp. GI1]|uniref:response regulator n=1 Tax=Myxosarcina sp. GI1 TaxID=1541065 RepID=UPI00068C4155|nr:response regulator [Myxosarcina sp. GI1]
MNDTNLSLESVDNSEELLFDEEELIIEEDLEEELEKSEIDSWKVLIVDDDLSVHQATRLALRNLQFENKNLTFLSAYTAEAAKIIIANNSDIAFILLDVVMEANNSGLELVKYIRTELNNKLVRIILRTGQPGEAPEESIITDYDINDYKLKVELTRNKLMVTAVASLRAYRDLVVIEQSNREIMVLYAALETVKSNLENLVDIRTQELQQEIEERKQVQKTLNLTQFSLDRARDAVYFLDSNANFFYVNEAATKFLGYSKEELLQMSLYDVDPQLSPSHWGDHWKKLKELEAFIFETIHFTKEGDYLPVEVTANYLNFEDREYNCAIVRDIRERKLAEAQLKEANQKLQYLAHIDELTQISNRRSFDDYFYREWLRMFEARQPLSLIFCDVDYFKKFNDCYGHPAGDDCLRQVAKTISNAVRRPGDLAARYGGEEFAVILPNTDINGAIQVATNIQREIRNLELVHKASEVSEYVTLSMGICSEIPNIELPPSTLITKADRALYRAKKLGRDRYCICEEKL